jgi:hypothetical protein
MRSIVSFVAVMAIGFLMIGCHPSEGERCNPLLFNDECTAGNPQLSCVYPPNCPVAYCCPMMTKGDPSMSISPNCLACPSPDMATDMSSAD